MDENKQRRGVFQRRIPRAAPGLGALLALNSKVMIVWTFVQRIPLCPYCCISRDSRSLKLSSGAQTQSLVCVILLQDVALLPTYAYRRVEVW